MVFHGGRWLDRRWLAAVLVLLGLMVALTATSGGAEAVKRSKSVRVFSTMQLETSRQGGYNEVEAGMENISDGKTVYAWIVATIVYADGHKDTIMRWRRPMELLPEHGFSAFILFLVPEGAPVGTATARVTARIVRTRDGDAAGAGPKLSYVVATDTFEVLPAK